MSDNRESPAGPAAERAPGAARDDAREPGQGRPDPGSSRRRRRRRTRKTTGATADQTPLAGSPGVGHPDAPARAQSGPPDEEPRKRRRRRRRKPGGAERAQESERRREADGAMGAAEREGGAAPIPAGRASAPSLDVGASTSAPLEFPDEEAWSFDDVIEGSSPAAGPTRDQPAADSAPIVARAAHPDAGADDSGRGSRRRRRPTKAQEAQNRPSERDDEADELDAEEVAPAARSRDPQQPSPFEYPSRPNDPDGEEWLEGVATEEAILAGTLRNVVCVHFGAARTPGDFDAGETAVHAGAPVLVESERGPIVGQASTDSMRRMMTKPLPRLLRLLRERDQALAAKHGEREQAARQICLELIHRQDLDMKLIRVEYLQNGGKALFYFSAENRVDFRELVRELARELRVRVEMRQVGVRDESKITGGLGPCGRELCCSSWIDGFHPVSIRMAKDQGLVLNPARVSGMCGRLKCCLAYEQQHYQEARKELPRLGQQVSTPKGDGTVHELDIPRKLVRVHRGDGTMSTFPASEITFAPPANKPKR